MLVLTTNPGFSGVLKAVELYKPYSGETGYGVTLSDILGKITTTTEKFLDIYRRYREIKRPPRPPKPVVIPMPVAPPIPQYTYVTTREGYRVQLPTKQAITDSLRQYLPYLLGGVALITTVVLLRRR